MSDQAQSEDTVNIVVNGEEIAATPGAWLIDACEDAGTYIPRFCYHKRMNPVGMCRMCLVEVDTGRGPALQPSCMLKVSPDMKVDTESEATKRAQDGVLELLLINHPLDCPVCDKGGECPLQDQTMAYGPGESRFVEEKRHFEKPIPISDNVYLDRERCILCDRCTRFAKEVAGDPLIHFLDRGNNTQVNTFPDEPFSSYFSGNTVQICPVGALTAKPYRFRARPWDLDEVDSTYPNAMGDRINIQASRNQVLRFQGVDSDAVNWGWLSDRDRFSFEAVTAPTRLTDPLVRGDGLGNPNPAANELVATSWANAISMTAGAIQSASPSRVGIIGGARLTNEAQYAWAKLAKGVIGTDNLDAQLDDGLPPDVVLALDRATISQVCETGGTVVLAAADPKEELGTLFLRLRHAVIEDRVTLIELTPTATGLSHLAKHSLRVRPGDIGAVAHALVRGEVEGEPGGIDAGDLTAASEAIRKGPIKVVVGRTSVAERARPIIDAIAAFAQLDGTKFLPVLRRGNINGALDLGMAPGLLPGRTSLAGGRAHFQPIWGSVPDGPGLDTAGILDAAARGGIDVLILLGADPLRDFPDPELAAQGLAGARTVVAVDLFANPSVALHADVVLPAAGFAEVAGTHTNIEGRITALRQKVTPPGTARADWMIAAELAFQLGADLGLESVEAITAEIARVSGTHQAATTEAVDADIDGVLVAAQPADGFPATFSWGDIGDPAPVQPVDAYSHRLVLDRTMYDEGTIASNCEAIAPIAAPGGVRMNSGDTGRLGVGQSSRVRISSSKASITAAVIVDDRVPRGTAAIALNHSGEDPRVLLDRSEAVTEVRIENV